MYVMYVQRRATMPQDMVKLAQSVARELADAMESKQRVVSIKDDVAAKVGTAAALNGGAKTSGSKVDQS